MGWNKFDTEKMVGLQLRAISGDVNSEFRETLKKLYMNEKGELTDVGESCFRWHWVIAAYFSTPEKSKIFINYIQICFETNTLLDKDEFWKMLLRMKLPDEFFSMMSKFTQVPQLAVRHIPRKKEDIKSRWE
jgi:hypothetical protein